MAWQEIIKISTKDTVADARRFMPEEAKNENTVISKKRAILDSYHNIVNKEFFQTKRGKKFLEVIKEAHKLLDYYENSYMGDESELEGELSHEFTPFLVQLKELAKFGYNFKKGE